MLFPITNEGIPIMVKQIQSVITDAEISAYDRGYADAQLAIRRAAGLSK